jgi:hypothetical protein
VILHHGRSVSQGHYTVLCKHEQQNRWYEFDDENVNQKSMEAIHRAAQTDAPYILVYEQQESNSESNNETEQTTNQSDQDLSLETLFSIESLVQLSTPTVIQEEEEKEEEEEDSSVKRTRSTKKQTQPKSVTTQRTDTRTTRKNGKQTVVKPDLRPLSQRRIVTSRKTNQR